MKNYRLKLKDLFKGRIVYLAEPGCFPVKAVVVGHSDDVIRFTTIAVDKSGRDKQDILKDHNGKYKLVDPAMLMKMAAAKGKPDLISEGDVGLMQSHIVPIKNVLLMDEEGNVIPVQDVYFNPAECRLRVFAKEKQADRYSDYPSSFGNELESIMTCDTIDLIKEVSGLDSKDTIENISETLVSKLCDVITDMRASSDIESRPTPRVND